jgi:uroporphyrin-III C-methyltransferase / precorrin-2 dehydrogenase / sirohydrochlorin ferrochelatase
MSLLPIFLQLKGRPGLLVGAGPVALDKLGSLLRTGLRLRVIAPDALSEIRQLAAEGRIEWVQRAFEPGDVKGNFVVVAATNEPTVNAAVYQAAGELGILCNSVDDIPHCDFFFGSVISRGNLQIAISTSGESPAVAQRLRREIDAQLPADLGAWLAQLGQLRREVLALHPPGEERKTLLHRLAELPVCASSDCPARQIALVPSDATEPAPPLFAGQPTQGSSATVSLVGAGPGDPDLLTVKALRLIQTADVILHDDLVSPAILDLASPCAEIINVGKRCGEKFITQEGINALMIARARGGHSVVRLKSGDPLIFSRASEEMSALREAGILFEVVSGVTAAAAAAAALGCALTSRDYASSVIFSAGHRAPDRSQPAQPREEATRVIYMPGRDLHRLAAELLAEGLSPELPCAVVSRAAQPDQQVRLGTLANLAGLEPTQAPSLVIAGWAVRSMDSAQFLHAAVTLADVTLHS